MTINELNNDFDPVTLQDIGLIKKYLSLANYEEANHNIINMFLWIDHYPLFKFQTENYLLLLGIHLNELFIYMPLCKKEYLAEALAKAKQIFDKYECPFVLSCYTSEVMQEVIKLYPEYHACHHRDNDDYVYEVARLISFKGNKLKKKRNHLNSFYKEYGSRYKYENLNDDNLNEVLHFLDTFEFTDDRMHDEELKGLRKLLMNYKLFDMKVGIIRIDQKVKAFAIGSHLSNRMCSENVEKADHSIRGLYQVMMKELLEHEFKNYEYVNREDDMGYENLRFAKMAYGPDFMIEKYRLCEGGR